MEKFLTILIHVLPCGGMGRGNGIYRVSGRVLASEGLLPPSGVNVTAKESNARVLTNGAGEFSLYLREVPALLMFSREGSVSQEIAIVPPLEAPQVIATTNYRLKDPGTLKNAKS